MCTYTPKTGLTRSGYGSLRDRLLLRWDDAAPVLDRQRERVHRTARLEADCFGVGAEHAGRQHGRRLLGTGDRPQLIRLVVRQRREAVALQIALAVGEQ